MLCISAVCSDGCVYGQCTSPGNCTCSTGYTGASCRTRKLIIPYHYNLSY